MFFSACDDVSEFDSRDTDVDWVLNRWLLYEVCSKSIGPFVGKNTIIYFDVWTPHPLQSSLLGNAHTSSSGPAIAGNISGKLLVESCVIYAMYVLLF
jgi:hypothetical protein